MAEATVPVHTGQAAIRRLEPKDREPSRAERSSSATIHPLPTAMLRRRRHESGAPPIEVKLDGQSLEATGTVGQLIDAGLCTHRHLPPGRQRFRLGHGRDGALNWHVNLLPRGRARICLILDLEHAIVKGQDKAKSLLDHLVADQSEFRRRILDAIAFSYRGHGHIRLDQLSVDRDGHHLGGTAKGQLQSIQQQIDALVARAEMVVSNAAIEFDADERARVVADARARLCPAMLPLPPVDEVGGK